MKFLDRLTYTVSTFKGGYVPHLYIIRWEEKWHIRLTQKHSTRILEFKRETKGKNTPV